MAKSFQFHFRQNVYSVTFRLGFSSLCLFLFCLCCYLGVWQLQRYHFKKTLLSNYTITLTAAPKPFLAHSTENTQFEKVSVQGDYLNELTMLVQNRFYQDQMGYEVLTPLKIPGDDKLLLINRGWIAKPHNQSLPILNPAKQKQNISGYIKRTDEYQFILGKNILQPNSQPLVMQKIDIKEISRVTHQTYYPFILRLDASQSDGFIRDWTIATVLPQRHMAYAVQWFALAIVLLIAYFGFCCERIQNGGKHHAKH